jgi:hypothetical protein
MKATRSITVGALWLCALLFSPVNARAQYGATPFHDPATGESYHIEAAGTIWNPTPDLTVASTQFGLAGTQISATDDLGITSKRVNELRLVLRPAKKHKFRLNYLPMTYTAQASVHRTLVFNGITYGINLPVATELKWKTWLLGYEYDFLYKDRWFVGLVRRASRSSRWRRRLSPTSAASRASTWSRIFPSPARWWG